MSNNDTFLLVQSYYDAFNAKDMNKLYGLLDEEVVHDINQGQTEIGRPAFEHFMTKMNEMYHETIHDLVILTSSDGFHAAAKFHIAGNYLKTEPGFPAAKGQTYVLSAAAFFEIQNKKIARVATYYNLEEWLKQVS